MERVRNGEGPHREARSREGPALEKSSQLLSLRPTRHRRQPIARRPRSCAAPPPKKTRGRAEERRIGEKGNRHARAVPRAGGGRPSPHQLPLASVDWWGEADSNRRR